MTCSRLYIWEADQSGNLNQTLFSDCALVTPKAVKYGRCVDKLLSQGLASGAQMPVFRPWLHALPAL